MNTEEGKQMNEQFWRELLDVLGKQNPDIKAMLNGR